MRTYLREIREEKKLSQTEMAEMLGCYQSYYSAIENDNRQKDMSLSMVKKIAIAFEMPMEVIINAENDYQESKLIVS